MAYNGAFGFHNTNVSYGGLTFKGSWDANANNPFLQSGVGVNGEYYIVNVAGTTNLDGVIVWDIGDWAIFNGATWDKVDNTDSVSSVNGFVGAVSLTTTNIPEGTPLYYTNARAIGSLLTGYVSGAGVVSATDTILSAIEKLNGNIEAIPSLSTPLPPVISQINNPPAHVFGERYLVGTAPTGAWVGFANNIAESDGATWTFTAPILNDSVFITSTLNTLRYNGTSWVAYVGTPILQNGNSFGTNVSIGTNDAYGISFKTANLTRATINGNGLVNIGNAPTTSQRLVRFGQGSSLVDIGSYTGDASDGAIYMGTSALIPSNTNYTLKSDGASTELNGFSSLTARVGGSTAYTLTSQSHTWQIISTGGTTTAYTFSQLNQLTIPAATDTASFLFNMGNGEMRHLAGALATQRDFRIISKVQSFNSASVLTEASTVSISGATRAGVSTTITNSNALTIESNNVVTLGVVTNSYGATINAQTGATNNYAARFLGGNTGFETSTPTAIGHFGASSVTRPSLRIEAGIAPSSASQNNGDVWNDNTQKVLSTNIHGASTIVQNISTILFTQTANQNVSNTLVETTLLGTGVGSKTLPANFFSVGKTLRLIVRGFFSRTSGNITIRFKIGATTIVATATVTSGAGSNNGFQIIVDCTCRTIGAVGTMIAQGYAQNMNNGNVIEMVSTATVVIDTTISNVVDETIQFSTANVGNTFTSTNSTLEVLN
jgi:hypothetical protein